MNNTDIEALKKIMRDIHNKDSNEVSWAYFVILAQAHIVSSFRPDSTSDRLRRYWFKLYKSLLAELGYSEEPGADNWYIIENALTQVNATTTSSATVPLPVESPSTSESPSTLESPKTLINADSSTTSRSRSKSSLGTPITQIQHAAALCLYSKMEDSKNGSSNLVDLLKTPAMHGILDLADANWCSWFLPDELLELKELVDVEIEYPPLPQDMGEFLRNIPNSSDLHRIYSHLEAQQVSLATQPSLAWLKISLQSAIYLFQGDYFPLSDQNERDIFGNVWTFIGRAFVPSLLKCRSEKASIASKESNNKKRKIAADDCMERQQNAVIPDMVVGFDSQEYAIVEAAKESNNTKQIVEGGKKCPEMMNLMYDRLVSMCPAEHRSIKVYGCLLSRMTCTPLELSNPHGYVKLFRRGTAINHPEEQLTFKPKMVILLAHIWRFKLAIESVLQVVIEGQYKHTDFCGNMKK
ncbi:hypothetical protein V8B55DRAFT_1528708 [Mucor lusitanicus]